MLILEGAQAGLSWETILNKRENYREAFDNFDARRDRQLMTTPKSRRFSPDPGIVRNRLKVNAAVKNAQEFLQGAEGVRILRPIHLAVCRRPAVQNAWKSFNMFRRQHRNRMR